jgi:hypothetical protein
MMKHGWNESEMNLDDDAGEDGTTEPQLELDQYEEYDATTLPWLPPAERRH